MTTRTRPARSTHRAAWAALGAGGALACVAAGMAHWARACARNERYGTWQKQFERVR